MTTERFAANLQNVSMVLSETQTLLAAYCELGDWGKVREHALDENLLGKRSTTTVRHILKVVRRRYLEAPDWLPKAPAFAFFAHPAIPVRAKAQVAFVYTLAEDVLARTVHQALVLSAGEGSYLHPTDVVRFLEIQASDHHELAMWKPYLRKRWAQGFLALLRNGGFAAAAPSWQLIEPVILPEGFALLFSWLVEHERSARAAFHHPGFQLWGLDDADKASLLRQGQQRGWWRYASGGAMVEFQPQYASVEELVGALG